MERHCRIAELAGLAPSALFGNTKTSSILTLAINREFVDSAANGTYSATVTITYNNSSTPQQSLSLPMELVINEPIVQTVAPYYLEGTKPLPIVLRGTGMSSVASVKFGSVSVSTYEVLSESVIRVTPPNLAPGTYTVTVTNALDKTMPGPSLNIVSTPIFGAAEVLNGATVYPARVIYDPVRVAIYVADRNSGIGGAVFRFRYSNGAWTRDTIVGPAFAVVDMTQLVDGKYLYLSSPSNNHLYSVDLDNLGATPKTLDTGFFAYIKQVVTLNDGSLFNGAVTFDPVSGEVLYRGGATGCPSLVGAEDGSNTLLLFGECYTPDAPNSKYDTLTGQFTFGPVKYQYENTAAITRSGSMISVYDTLYDSLFHVVGSITAARGGAAFSPDAKRHYSVVVDGIGKNLQLQISDVSAAPPSGGLAPLVATIPITNGEAYSPYSSFGIVTPDGATYLLIDSTRLLVVPIPAENRP